MPILCIWLTLWTLSAVKWKLLFHKNISPAFYLKNCAHIVTPPPFPVPWTLMFIFESFHHTFWGCVRHFDKQYGVVMFGYDLIFKGKDYFWNLWVFEELVVCSFAWMTVVSPATLVGTATSSCFGRLGEEGGAWEPQSLLRTSSLINWNPVPEEELVLMGGEDGGGVWGGIGRVGI